MYGSVRVVPEPSHTYWHWPTNLAGQCRDQKCNCCTFDHGIGRPNWSGQCKIACCAWEANPRATSERGRDDGGDADNVRCSLHRGESTLLTINCSSTLILLYSSAAAAFACCLLLAAACLRRRARRRRPIARAGKGEKEGKKGPSMPGKSVFSAAWHAHPKFQTVQKLHMPILHTPKYKKYT